MMRKIRLFVIALVLLITLDTQAQGTQLELAYYLGGEFDDRAQSVAVDEDGFVYIAINTGKRFMRMADGSLLIVPECRLGQGAGIECPFVSVTALRNILVLKLGPSGELIYTTIVGGNGPDEVTDIAVDQNGNAYLVGTTSAPDFPVHRGSTDPRAQAFQATLAGDDDAFVVRLDSNGQMDAATFLGGGGADRINAVAIDGLGRIAIAGNTDSTDLPVQAVLTLPNVPLANAAFAGGSEDGFVAVLTADLEELVWSQYFGGAGADEVLDLAVDSNNMLWVTGVTDSQNLSETGAGFAGGYQGGPSDAWIGGYNFVGVRTVLAYWGGGSDDEGLAIAVDANDEIVLAGSTDSDDLPTSPRAIRTSRAGSTDGYISRFRFGASTLQAADSTYIGGTGEDSVQAVVTDGSGRVIAGGVTRSGNLPTSSGATQRQIGSHTDAFMLRLNQSLDALDYGTFLGGNGLDRGNDVAVDNSNIVYLAGSTNSDDLPIPDHINDQLTGSGVSQDAFVAKWTPSNLLPADIEITKSASPDPVNVTDVLTYTLTVTNNDAAVGNDATNVVVTDELPPEATFVSVSSNGANCVALSSTTIRCTRAFLAKGDSFTIQIQVIPQIGGITIRNTTIVDSEVRDHVRHNNEAVVDTAVNPHLALQLQRTAEITQGIQDLGNHVSLVERKNTVVRVFPEAHRGTDTAEALDLHGRLFGFRDVNGQRQPLPGSPLTPDNGSVDLPATGQDRSDETLSFNYTLPYTWTFGRINLEATLGTDSSGQGTDRMDVKIAARSSITDRLIQSPTIRFWRVAPVCMRTYQVRTPNGELGERFLVDNADGRDMVSLATDLLPTNEIALFLRSRVLASPYSAAGYFSTADIFGDDLDSTSILARLWFIDQTSRDPRPCRQANARTHYIATVNVLDAPRGGTATSGVVQFDGGPHQIPFAGQDQLWFDANPNPPAGANTVGGQRINDPRGGRNLAHELGHNYFRSHINCGCNGLPAGPDLQYPFNACSIGQTGANEFYGLNTRTMTPIGPQMTDDPVGMATTGNPISDLMSYSCVRWPSSYFWAKTFFYLRCQEQNFCEAPDPEIRAIARGTDPLPVISAMVMAQPVQSASSVLIGTAIWDRDQGQLLSTQWQVMESEWLPEEKLEENFKLAGDSDSLVMTLRDGQGTALGSHSLASLPPADTVGDATVELVTFQVPVSEAVQGFDIQFEGSELARVSASRSAPEVRVIAPRRGARVADAVEVRWEANDADGDTLGFTVQYSRDDGESWETLAEVQDADNARLDLSLVGGDTRRARIRVLASDGFHTTAAVSPHFTVADQSPIAFISRPRDGAEFVHQATVVAEGAGYDPESGYESRDDLEWTLNGQRQSVGGPRLILDSLDPGDYELTLTTRDSSSTTGSHTIQFRVLADSDPADATTGIAGRVMVREPGGQLGGPIAGARIQFVSEDRSVVRSLLSDANGSYRVELPPGRYRVTAKLTGFTTFDSAPGFFVVTNGRFNTGNIFMATE